MARGRFLYSLVIASLLGLLSLEAGATSFVMVSDADLADEATLIAEVRIEASRAAAASGLPATLYNARVLEVLKGEAPGETLTVRVAGGATQQGQALRFWGAPSFATGTQAVLFLVPRRDGSWGVLHWMLGAFYQVELGRRPALLRNLDEATELRRAPGGGFEPVIDSVDLPRDPAAFKGWLAARARGEKAAPSYFLEAGSAEARLAEKFTFILPGDGIPIRWFEFASGGSIGWRADTTGQVGVPGGAFSEFQAALSAWTNDGGSLINYAYRGKTSSRATQCAEPFPEGKIVFDDPSSDIDGSYDCLRGGVLAVGGPCFADGDLQTFNGRSYHPAGDAFVITNDNLDCFFESTGDPSCSARELFTHELGHTLGLGHSADRSATMYAFFHGDGRCNALRSDDRAAVAFLYPGGGGGGGTSVGAPTNLTATVFSASQINLSWQDNSNNETEFRIEAKTTGNFADIGSAPAGATTFSATGLAASTAYSFRVRAHATGNNYSAYSNTATATTRAPGPNPPSGLQVLSRSATSITLGWTDNSTDETNFRISRKGYSPVEDITLVGPNTTSLVVNGLSPATRYEFEVKAVNAVGTSAASNRLAANTNGLVGACVPNDTTLCLEGGAVKVEVNFNNGPSSNEQGHALPLTAQTGAFWFFNPANTELIVKAINAQAINGNFWIFFGALSDVDYWVRATNTATGAAAVYYNPKGLICGGADTMAFAVSSASIHLVRAPAELAKAVAPVPAAELIPAPQGVCAPSSTTLCLLGSRFAVTVDWRIPSNGQTGTGQVVPGSDFSGEFWFFNASNYELVVKVIDGRTINGKFWVFYGALSDVVYNVHVRDTQTGAEKVYSNAAGNFCGQADTAAF